MKYITKLILLVTILINVSTSSPVAALGVSGEEVKNIPEWQMKNTSRDVTLLLSDSPEMVTIPGILYQDKVVGQARLFFYHVNASKKPKRMEVLLVNDGSQTAQVTITQSSLGRPGYDWLAVGKNTMMEYLAGGGGEQVIIPPGKAQPLSSRISARPVLPNMLSHGIFDFVTDQELTVKVLMVPMFEDSVEFSKMTRILPADAPHLRGTFSGANRQLSPARVYDPEKDGTVAVTLADNNIDVYLRGTDALTGQPVINYGNYGVVYRIALPSKVGSQVGYYLVPLGGYYAGAIGINHPSVMRNPLATPTDRTYYGSNGVGDFTFLGAYDSGDGLSFTFSPPGASNLPIKIIMLPQ